MRNLPGAIAAACVAATNYFVFVENGLLRMDTTIETIVFVGTLPSSLLSWLIRSRDPGSIGLWFAASAVWTAAAYLQFSALAAMPRFLATRPLLRTIVMSVSCIAFFVCVAWLIAAWPSGPEEDPTIFFIRSPLIGCAAAAILLLLSWFSGVTPGKST